MHNNVVFHVFHTISTGRFIQELQHSLSVVSASHEKAPTPTALLQASSDWSTRSHSLFVRWQTERPRQINSVAVDADVGTHMCQLCAICLAVVCCHGCHGFSMVLLDQIKVQGTTYLSNLQSSLCIQNKRLNPSLLFQCLFLCTSLSCCM